MADFRTAPGGALAFIPAMVLYDTSLTDKAKLVYAEIARLLGPDGYCWARDQYLADVCSCSVKTVSRAIHDLAAAGYIQVEHGANKKGSERHIYIGAIAPAPDPQRGMDKNVHTVKNDQRGTVKNDQTPPPTQDKKTNKDTDIRAGAGARAHTRVLPPDVDAVFLAFAGDDAELYQRIMELAEVRRSKRDPYKTPAQAKKLCNKLRNICGTDRAYMLTGRYFDFVEASSMTVQEIKSLALARRYDVVIIDYVQLIKPTVRGDRQEQMQDVSIQLRAMAQLTGITVIALAQLRRPDSRPARTDGKSAPPAATMADLKETGQFEQDADTVLLMYLVDPEKRSGDRYIKIEKNKDGHAGLRGRFSFDGKKQLFTPVKGDGSSLDGSPAFHDIPDDDPQYQIPF